LSKVYRSYKEGIVTFILPATEVFNITPTTGTASSEPRAFAKSLHRHPQLLGAPAFETTRGLLHRTRYDRRDKEERRKKLRRIKKITSHPCALFYKWPE
jgi:hypothetical protein